MSNRHEFIAAFRDCGREFLDSIIPVLESQRAEATINLYDPVADEVMGGLFSGCSAFCRRLFLITTCGRTTSVGWFSV